jgi:Putative Ig domain
MATMATLLYLFTVVEAVPRATFPINAQVPPVARVSELFSFSFSASTFSSDIPILNYTLSNAPAWLRLDGGNRAFSGTPTLDDVGPVTVQLTATDFSGSAEMDATFVVSANPSPQLGRPISDQLRAFGSNSGPSSIRLYPASPFSFSFSKDMFIGNGGELVYYAVSSDHTPLPSWVSFDSGSLQFSGVSPPWVSLIAPPQQFGIHLIASDVIGFAGAIASFSFVVSDHMLVFSNDDETVDATEGIPIDISDLRSRLLLDDHPIKDGDLGTVKADVPGWLGFDDKTLALHGTPPPGVASGVVNVSVVDVYGDVATAVIHVRVSSALFTGSIGNLNATAGRQFNYTINRTIFKDTNVAVKALVNPPTSWLAFDPGNLQFEGHVPYDAVPADIIVNLTATSRSSLLSDFRVFIIKVENANIHTTSATRSSAAAPTKSKVNASQTKSSSGDIRNCRGKLAALIVVPCLFLVATVAAIIFWCRHSLRRNAQSKSRRRPTISWPLEHIAGPWPVGERVKSLDYEAPRRAPLLGALSAMWKSNTDFQSLSYQRARNKPESGGDLHSYSRDANSLGEHIRELARPPREGSTTSELTVNFSPKTPTRPQRYSRQSDRAKPPIKRNSQTFDRYSNGNGIPPLAVYRLSGVGHGAGSYGRLGNGISKPSWRTGSSRGWGTARSSDTSAITESTDVLLDGFPSIRVVTSPDPARLPTTELDQQSIVRHRGQSPFFGSSREVPSQGSSPVWGYRTRPSFTISQMQPEDSASLLDSILRDLSSQGTVGHFSPASIDEHGRVFETRANARSSRISQASKVSDASSRFRSTSASPQLSRDESGFAEVVDEAGLRYWKEGNFADRGSFYCTGDSRGSILEYETVRLQGVAGGGSPAAPIASPRLKLVDFKGKRPVSVDVHVSRRVQSRTEGMAFL